MELVFEIPAVGLVLREIVDDGMQVSEQKSEFLMVRMQEWNCGNLTQVLHLVLNTHRLLYEIFVTVAGDFLVKVLENGRDEDKAEVFMGRFYLELLQHLGQERQEILRDLKVVNDNKIFLSGFLLQHCFCQFVLALAHRHQNDIFILPIGQVFTNSVDWILAH